MWPFNLEDTLRRQTICALCLDPDIPFGSLAATQQCCSVPGLQHKERGTCTLSHRMLNSLIARKQGMTVSSASTSTLESSILSLSTLSTIDLYPGLSPPLGPYLTKVLAVASRNLQNETANAAISLHCPARYTNRRESDPDYARYCICGSGDCKYFGCA
jgi:hypothetical protein